MSIVVTNRAINVVGSGNETYLLANSGQLVREEITFTCNYTFRSTSDMPTQLIDPKSLKLLGGSWGDFGFLVGDSVLISYTFSDGQGSSTSVTDGQATITDINGDIITFNNVIVGNFNEWTGALSPQGSYNSQMVIKNSSRSAPEQIVFKHNLTENANTLNLGSLIDGTVNTFEFNSVDSMAVNDTQTGVWLGNHSGGSYVRYELTRYSDLGGLKRYRLALFYFLPDYDGDEGEPFWFENDECLKSVYEIALISQNNNPNGALTAGFSHVLGNTGWYDEEHNGGINYFNVQSIDILVNGVAVNTLDYSQTNNVKIVVRDQAPISADAEVKFDMFPESDYYKNNQYSHLENRNTSYANTSSVSLAFGRSGAEFKINNLTTTQIGNDLEVEFDIVPNAAFTSYVESLEEDARGFRLSVSVQSDTGINNNVSLTALLNVLELAPIPDEPFNDYDELGFITHPLTINDTHVTNLESRTEDDMVFHSIFRLNKSVEWEEMRLRVFVRRTSDNLEFNLESRTIPFSQFPMVGGVIQLNHFEEIQQFLDAPERNKLSLKLTGNETGSDYEVELIWSLMNNWRYWIANNNAFLDFYDINLPNNGRNNEWVRYLMLSGYQIITQYTLVKDGVGYFASSMLDIKDYDDWQGVSVINLYDENNNPVNSLISGQTMRVEALHTLNTGNWQGGDVWGWLAFRPFESEVAKRISTVWDWTSQDLPFRPLAGETKAKLTLSGAVAKVEALIDCSMIDTENSTLVARIESPIENPCIHPIEHLINTIMLLQFWQGGTYYSKLLMIMNGDYKPPLQTVCCQPCDYWAIGNYRFLREILGGSGCCITDYNGISENTCGGDDTENFNQYVDEIFSILDIPVGDINPAIYGAYNNGVNDMLILKNKLEFLLTFAPLSDVQDICQYIITYGIKFTCDEPNAGYSPIIN